MTGSTFIESNARANGPGIAQVQVAARLKRPQSFVSKYEPGERRLDAVESGVAVISLYPGLLRTEAVLAGGGHRRGCGGIGSPGYRRLATGAFNPRNGLARGPRCASESRPDVIS